MRKTIFTPNDEYYTYFNELKKIFASGEKTQSKSKTLEKIIQFQCQQSKRKRNRYFIEHDNDGFVEYNQKLSKPLSIKKVNKSPTYLTQIQIFLNEAAMIYLSYNYSHDKIERKTKLQNLIYHNKSPFILLV